MKLRTKIMMAALLPVFILGLGIFILAADRIANGIYDNGDLCFPYKNGLETVLLK